MNALRRAPPLPAHALHAVELGPVGLLALQHANDRVAAREFDEIIDPEVTPFKVERVITVKK